MTYRCPFRNSFTMKMTRDSYSSLRLPVIFVIAMGTLGGWLVLATLSSRARSSAYSIEDGSVFVNSLGMKFVAIPPGEFMMGVLDSGDTSGDFPGPESDCPHTVRFTRPFFLGVCEVTQSQYATVMGKNPSWHNSRERLLSDPYRVICLEWLKTVPESARLRTVGCCSAEQMYHYDPTTFPVEMVTWNQANDFCERLSALSEEIIARRHYRLPTEAEWEYACRSCKSHAYVFTAERNVNDTSGDNSNKAVLGAYPILAVASFSPNEVGVFDMRGNVSELCSDWYARDYYARSPATDPRGPEVGYLKVVRASDSKYVGEQCKISGDLIAPWKSSPYIGFRVVCEIGGETR